MKKIVFTGGGSAGHVTPNIAIINELDRKSWEIHYIGSKKGIEKELIEKINIPYYPISSGKLRRYIDFENIKDVFRVCRGILNARSILKKIKPRLVFSKGGFVSVPVILAAKSLKIPIFIHESDITPGLANKISQRFASKIFTSFEQTKQYFPPEKTITIGSPIRKEIFQGSQEGGYKFLAFTKQKPVITVMGGSQGSKRINEIIRDGLAQLTQDFQVVHLCGKNHLDLDLQNVPNYRQFAYLDEELADILSVTDFIITRGGSNSIFEFLALQIPMLIIPLPKKQSRGDQILNAQAFTESGYALMLKEEELTEKALLSAITQLKNQSDSIRGKMITANQSNALEILVKEINQ